MGRRCLLALLAVALVAGCAGPGASGSLSGSSSAATPAVSASEASAGSVSPVSPERSAAAASTPSATAAASSERPAASVSLTPAATPIARASLRGTIVYSSDAGGNDDVFLLRLDGSQPVRLTDGPEKEFDPALSPDGRQIAYRRNPRPDSDAADIWVMDLDGGHKRDLTNAPDEMNWAPTWTPDGRIAFSSMRGAAGTLELWVMDRDGSGARRVSKGWCEYAQPSPDGSAFTCASGAAGAYDIVIVDAATGERRPLTATPVTEFAPSWSPDGRWIVFQRDTGEHWVLVRTRPDGSDEQQVAGEGAFPTWDPDGHLVWSGPGGIDVANADGSGRIALDYPAGFISWGR